MQGNRRSDATPTHDDNVCCLHHAPPQFFTSAFVAELIITSLETLLIDGFETNLALSRQFDSSEFDIY
jgi:hypothetical protein